MKLDHEILYREELRCLLVLLAEAIARPPIAEDRLALMGLVHLHGKLTDWMATAPSAIAPPEGG